MGRAGSPAAKLSNGSFASQRLTVFAGVGTIRQILRYTLYISVLKEIVS